MRFVPRDWIHDANIADHLKEQYRETAQEILSGVSTTKDKKDYVGTNTSTLAGKSARYGAISDSPHEEIKNDGCGCVLV